MTVPADAGTLATRKSAQMVADEAHARIDDALRQVIEAAGEVPLEIYLRGAGERAHGSSQMLLSAYDRVMAELSRHLVGMEVAVCPAAEATPEGAGRVQAHLVHARRLETTVRRIEQLLWGDAQAPSRRLDLLHRDLVEQMAAHRTAETAMLQGLESALGPGAQTELGGRLERATRQAPTRSHPHAARRLGWTHTLYRPVAAWDRMLDAVNSRPYPRLNARKPKEPGVWGSYVLGRMLPAQRRKK